MQCLCAGSRPEDYRELGQSESNIQVRDDGTLVINTIQKRDEGFYLCEANNGIGPVLSAVIYVNVQCECLPVVVSRLVLGSSSTFSLGVH